MGVSLKPRSWFSFFGVCAPLKGTMKGSVATAATARSILRITRTVTQTSVRQRKRKHQIARRHANVLLPLEFLSRRRRGDLRTGLEMPHGDSGARVEGHEVTRGVAVEH